MTDTALEGQLAIDGLDVSERHAAIQGTIEVSQATFDRLQLGDHLRVIVTARVSSKTDKHKRDSQGDDSATRTVGLGIIETHSAKPQMVDGQEVTGRAEGAESADGAGSERKPRRKAKDEAGTPAPVEPPPA